jgi:hypothetical protein
MKRKSNNAHCEQCSKSLGLSPYDTTYSLNFWPDWSFACAEEVVSPKSTAESR